MTELLNQLGSFLMDVRSTDSDVAARVEAVSALYHAGGIPRDADRLQGLVLVAATYKLLQADPGYLSPELAKSFSEDLRNMYRDLGGAPWLLG